VEEGGGGKRGEVRGREGVRGERGSWGGERRVSVRKEREG